MAKLILAVNAGSSSVKIGVYKHSQSSAPPEKVYDAQISSITKPPATFDCKGGSSNIQKKELGQDIKTQDDAFKYILEHLISDQGLPEIQNRENITTTCHRVVHGGDYEDATVITQETYHHLEDLTALAPLHNASALAIVKSCIKELPHSQNIAYFDSAFHHTVPEHIQTYPIDQKVAKSRKLRKYGFHGISYAFILRSVAEHLGKNEKDTSIIALHLGSGASVCAIKDGKSIDTSMGLTPLAGLPGATRSGDVDPSLVFHFTSEAGKLSPSSSKDMHISTAEEILNKKSGWAALTGTTNFGEIASSQEPTHRLAFSILVDRILGFVGSYFVKLDGKVDALVFAGGIGEKSDLLREKVVEGVRCLGFEIDAERNRKLDDDAVIVDVGKDDGSHKKKVLVCKTDEEFEMARACAASQNIKPAL